MPRTTTRSRVTPASPADPAREPQRAPRFRRRILVVTGSRAEFGLLHPVMSAIAEHRTLELVVAVAGSHLVPAAPGAIPTWRDVAQAGFEIHTRIAMQRPRRPGVERSRLDDAHAVARGVAGVARTIPLLSPHCVVVLGDRIEAFAAASAAAVAGVPLAHIHGGDRAEGIADESLRHAITRLAHLHFPASAQSAERIIRSGEPESSVYLVGSPGIDPLASIPIMPDAQAGPMGPPRIITLLHPAGLAPADEADAARALILAIDQVSLGPTLALAPNLDPGREAIDTLLRRRCGSNTPDSTRWFYRSHLARSEFVGVLKRLALPAGPSDPRRGVLIGNSSAGMIEAGVLGVPVVNIGPRQAGRERTPNVIDVPNPTPAAIARAIRAAASLPAVRLRPTTIFGAGTAGTAIARILAETPLLPSSARDAIRPEVLRKRLTF
jgi:UDP-hydrolysing UDP-N-acetyl-D-glucosamine 2-epimerase